MKNKILSICIPTYNRAEFLCETIESILNQITPELADKIEICISDNASTDNTFGIIQQYKNKNICDIVYNRNSENLGADSNFLKVIDIANGEYCWFLGSDDKIIEQGIDYILFKVLSSKADLYIFNRNEYSNDFNKFYRTSDWFYFGENEEVITFNKSQAYQYFKKCKTLGAVFSFISCLVFKKQKWDRIANKNRFNGTLYSHTFVLFSMLKSFDFTIHYLNKPLINCRLNNDEQTFTNVLGRYNRAKVDYYYILIAMDVFGIDSYEVKELKRILKNERSIKNLLAVKSLSNKEDIKRLHNLLYNFGFYKEYIILKIFPENVVKNIRILYKTIKGLIK